jgi:hypothetical protein
MIMREMMQKALSALNGRKETKVTERDRRSAAVQPSSSSEDWGMSPEDALKASMVSGYK